jgi:hypothetical protein
MTKILISLTTLSNPDWCKNIDSLNKFGIKEFAFFPTVIKTADERMEIMKAIKKELGKVNIPFCHIRNDMAPVELDFLIDNFGTQKMNIHSGQLFSSQYDYSKYKKMIFIENAGPLMFKDLPEETLKSYAGLCLDLSHLESARKQKASAFGIITNLVKKYPIGANHISAITNELRYVEEIDAYTYDRHCLEKLSEVDYIKQYYSDYFGEYAAIELWNSIESQIEIKQYIEKILGL